MSFALAASRLGSKHRGCGLQGRKLSFKFKTRLVEYLEMASLQHVTKDERNSWKLRVQLGKARKVIGLGAMSEDNAQNAKENVEHLLECLEQSRIPCKRSRNWLDQISDRLHARLAALGLCEARLVRELPTTVIAYSRNYIAGRTDWKKPENYQQAVDKLEQHLGRDIPLVAMNKGEGERWHRWMIDQLNLSPNTAGQSVKRVRQILKAAIDDGLLDKNPLTGIKIDLSSDKTKNRFIDVATSQAILESCPDKEWRVIFALARFGGLRCPSEVLGLNWSDVNWERGRFKVRSPKTKRSGKGERVVPLFPELRQELSDLWAEVQPGLEVPLSDTVIKRYRHTEQNLRSQLHRIADKAGVERWPKPFMCLRSTRRTELERTGRFANHVLNDWFGHSGAIAETHYLQTTEEDFEEAGEKLGVHLGIPSQGHQESPRDLTKCKNPGKTGVLMSTDGSGRAVEYTPEDSNL